jgi:hypothetical protein
MRIDLGFARLHRSNALILVIVLIGFEIGCIAFYPGIPNVETNFIISEGISRRYLDWHSPLLAFAIGYVSRLVQIMEGYPILYVLTQSAYWLSLGLVAQTESKTFGRRIILILLAGVLPPIFVMTICLTEDTMMGLTFFLTFAFLRNAERSGSVIALMLGFLSLFAAVCVKSNAAIAALPFGIWAVRILLRRLKTSPAIVNQRYFRLLAGILLVILMVGVKDVASTELVQAKSINPAQMLELWDLVGIAVRSKENCVPKIYSSPPTGTTSAYLADIYSEVSSTPLFWPRSDGSTTPMGFVNGEASGAILRNAWLTSIQKHPIQYLAHRSEAYLSALGILHTDKLILPYSNNLNSRSPAMGFVPYWTMSGWPYMTIALILSVLYLNRLLVLMRFQVVLLASGILYGLSFFFLGIDNTQSYFYWTIFSTVLVIATTVSNPYLLRRIFKRRAPSDEIGQKIISDGVS